MRGSRAPIRHLLVLAWSVVVWSGLWFEFSWANTAAGLLVGSVTLALVPPARTSTTTTVRPLALVKFAAYSLWSLIRASAIVAWEVVTPQNRIHQGIVATPLRTTSPGVITLIANVISLTPGTLTLEVHEETSTLFVHILHLRTVDEVREDIHRLEALAVRAFPAVPRRHEESP